MRRLLLSLFVAACSNGKPPTLYSGCPQTGPLVSILVDDEHLYGTASIMAKQDISGSGALSIIVCATAGDNETWRLDVEARSVLDADASSAPPLPLTTSDELDLPSPNVSAYAQSYLHGTALQNPVTSAQIVASAGHIHGSAVAGDGGVATFDGMYALSCSTNEPDPQFLTTFCKQFEPLAPP